MAVSLAVPLPEVLNLDREGLGTSLLYSLHCEAEGSKRNCIVETQLKTSKSEQRAGDRSQRL